MALKQIKTVSIVVKPNHSEALATAAELSAWLKTKGIEQIGEPVSADENGSTESSHR